MKNIFKRITALVLILCIVFTSAASAETVSFKDLKDNWAKPYILEAAGLGLIKGYSDGTFRQTNNITRFDMMIMLSRLYTINPELRTQIENKYTPFIKDVAKGDNEWAYKEMSVALALKLLSQDKFKTLYQSGSIFNNATREDVAVFVVKAMCLQNEVDNLAGKVYTMPFKDSNSIFTDYLPYVYVAYKHGIISGDDAKNFNPKNPITREAAAKMISLAYKYVTDNKVVPQFESFETYTSYKGTVEKITINPIESYLELKLDNGESKVIKLIENQTVINIDKKVSSIQRLEKGMLVECSVSDKNNVAKNITVDTSVSVVEGKIKYVYFTSPMKLVIVDKNNVERAFDINSNVIVTKDGLDVQFKNLSKADVVYVRLVDNVVTRVDSIGRLQTYKGKIKNIEYDIPIKLLLEDASGKVNTFTYSIEPYVTRNSVETTFDQLRVGDEVIIKTEYDILTAIDAKSVVVSKDANYVIKEITIGAANKVKLADNNGNIAEYKINNGAKISVMNSSASIYDLRVGYKVNVELDGNEVIAIDAAETETSQKIFGKIVYVNKEKGTVMLKTVNASSENEIVYLSIDSKTVIMTLAGRPQSITDFRQGMDVICVGSYSGGTFNAVSVIIE